jgi:hypothetical protein
MEVGKYLGLLLLPDLRWRIAFFATKLKFFDEKNNQDKDKRVF